ncbi:unnamed protein product [Phaeothamnion confervicola]
MDGIPLSEAADDGGDDNDDASAMSGNGANNVGQLSYDSFHTKRLKLFPSVVEAPWLVRKAVGNKPTLLAQKLTCRWFRGNNYVELDIDVGSSRVALQATSLAMGYARNLVIDLGFSLQSEFQEELPERLLGSVRLKYVDVELACPLHDGGLDFGGDDDDAGHGEGIGRGGGGYGNNPAAGGDGTDSDEDGGRGNGGRGSGRGHDREGGGRYGYASQGGSYN